MPRRHRRLHEPADSDRLESLNASWRRTEQRRGVSWTVQPITAARALKAYRCPGCDRVIPIATAHLAVWRADGVLGDRSDLDARRHWHEHCWRIA